jgi:division/cell wall cluster transcriptional repressor MraZ
MGNSVTVDQKGRLKIPISLLVPLKESDSKFYVTSEDGDSVRIYPMQVWSQFEERLEQLCLSNGNYRKFLARAKYFGQAVALDNQGTVLIPLALRRSAHIKGAVDVLDYLSYLEVWNHSRFLKSLKNNPITAQDENLLNEQLSSVVRVPPLANRKKKKEQDPGKIRRFALRRPLRSGSNGQTIRAIRKPDLVRISAPGAGEGQHAGAA